MGDPCTITRLVKNGKYVPNKKQLRGGYYTSAILMVKLDDRSEVQTKLVNLRADDGIREIYDTVKAVDPKFQEIPD
jgi:alpha-N-acetylglucosamine transferase